MTAIALIGAGGKMGFRCASNLRNAPYETRYVEIASAGRERLAAIGIAAVSAEQALAGADIVVLAVPDSAIGKVTQGLNPMIRPDVMVVCLDAAAPFAGGLPARDDVAYFVTHPCHPPIFNDETELEAKRDYYGGIKAHQHIVCALMQGSEDNYARGEALARQLFAPVLRSHRLNVGQMALLEPALSETVSATCVDMIREAMEETVRRGVPAQAARDFVLGHLTIQIAILFGELPGVVFSDAANKALELARSQLFQPDWKKVFEPAAVAESIQMITRPAG
jgi:hypothetical protein